LFATLFSLPVDFVVTPLDFSNMAVLCCFQVFGELAQVCHFAARRDSD
jgi:hypothetical protein